MREIIPGVVAMTMDEFIDVATATIQAETEAENPGFGAWKKQLDEEVWRRAGCSIDDLPDVPMLDWFQDGMCAGKAAGHAIAYANGGELP